MTTNPITPPRELVRQWLDEYYKPPASFSGMAPGEAALHIATQAARWGADQELKACCAHIHSVYGKNKADWLRDLRRPKPSLKKQATFAAAVLQSPDETCSIAEIAQHWHTIRRALEQLDD